MFEVPTVGFYFFIESQWSISRKWEIQRGWMREKMLEKVQKKISLSDYSEEIVIQYPEGIGNDK